jgi:O-acetyl-ADP-ribose deacetylase (regulator of RNase III)
MIEFRADGSLLDSGAEALVNPVNCEGIMGKGVALEFKTRFSHTGMLRHYQTLCSTGLLMLGEIGSFQLSGVVHTPLIVFFPTKDRWRDKSQLSWIAEGLKSLRELIEEEGIKSIAMPALGCGNGGLKWPDVKTAIEVTLGTLDCHVIVYEPKEA